MASNRTLALRGEIPAPRVYICAKCAKRSVRVTLGRRQEFINAALLNVTGGTLQKSGIDGLLYHPSCLPESPNREAVVRD